MHGWQAVMTGTAVAVATGSMLALLLRRRRQDADALFAVVSGSMALSLMAPLIHDAPTWMQIAVVVGGSFTCNGFWLVSRALFRGPDGVGRVHVAVAAGVALLIAGYRIASLEGGSASPWAYGLDGVLTLASSSLLVLSFLEPLRGWSATLAPAERRLRVGFMAVFAGCVLSTTLAAALAPAWPVLGVLRPGLIAVCVIAIVLFTQIALHYRRGAPLPSVAARGARTGNVPVPLGAADTRLLEALRHQLDVREIYREPELKVADLARRLGTAEHKLSRLIVGPLGEKNFNQMLNRRRIACACRRLSEPGDGASILEISGECGFASLGPFNRAFKAEMGCTPTAYRASRQAGDPGQSLRSDAAGAGVAR